MGKSSGWSMAMYLSFNLAFGRAIKSEESFDFCGREERIGIEEWRERKTWVNTWEGCQKGRKKLKEDRSNWRKGDIKRQ